VLDGRAEAAADADGGVVGMLPVLPVQYECACEDELCCGVHHHAAAWLAQGRFPMHILYGHHHTVLS